MATTKHYSIDAAKSSPILESLSATYAKESTQLDKIRQKMEALLTLPTIHESDAVRLSRAIRLIDEYRPDRPELQEEKSKPLNAFERKFSALFSYLSRRKKTPPKTEKPENPYLLAESSILAVRNLRYLDRQIHQNLPYENADTILGQTFNGEPATQQSVNTSITLSYEKKNWGIERICLDGIQNHLPSDSNGSQLWVQFLVDGRWVAPDQARDRKTDVKAVRFVDDGVGFDAQNLSLMWSTKVEEEGSRGQFGEGMKMIAASSIREKLGMVIESQNWRATPQANPVSVRNTRSGKDETVDRLAFNIEHFDMKQLMLGSRTTFLTPTPAFIEETINLGQKVLELRPHYRPLFTSEHGTIVDTAPGDIFVKGIRVTHEETVFSYDFPDAQTNRDRNALVKTDVPKRVLSILKELDNVHLIKTLIQRSVVEREQHHETVENSGYYSIGSKYPELWKKAFEDCFGKNACLDTGFEIPSVIDTSRIRRVNFALGIHKQLHAAGVKSDFETIPDFHFEKAPTSLTMQYGGDAWNEQRIFLDGVQNHLPRDSGGSKILLTFRVKETGQWKDCADLPKFRDEEIDALRISDDGRGFDQRLLTVIGSTKGDGDSAGKFGEGLKMLSIAGLKNGIPIIIRSRNWMAISRTEPEEIEGKAFDRLVFEFTRELKPEKLETLEFGRLDRYYNMHEASATVFQNPTSALIQEFRNARESVLALSDPEPIARTPDGDILHLNGGKLYVRDIMIPGDHDLQYSYHLHKFDIKSRDRNSIADGELREAIGKIWGHTENKEVIKDFLLQATHAATTGRVPIDFDTLFSPQNQDVWVRTFRETFGKKCAYKYVASADFNAVHTNQHMGLDTVIMPTKVCKILSRCVDSDGRRIASYQESLNEANKIEIIPDDDLNPIERETLRFLREDVYPAIVSGKEIEVVAFEPRGEVGAAGLCGNPVKMNRSTLDDKAYAANVFIHEVAHNETGAKDADSAFRDFLSQACANLVIVLLNSRKAEPQPEAPGAIATKLDAGITPPQA